MSAPTIVQPVFSASSASSSAPTLALTSLTKGNAILVGAALPSGSSISTPTDSQGNLYVQLVTTSGANASLKFYLTTNIAAGSNTITSHFGLASVSFVAAYELSNVPDWLSNQTLISGSSGAAAASPGTTIHPSATPNQANCMVFGMCGGPTTGVTITGTGYAIDASTTTNMSAAVGHVAAPNDLSTSNADTFNFASTSVNAIAVMLPGADQPFVINSTSHAQATAATTNVGSTLLVGTCTGLWVFFVETDPTIASGAGAGNATCTGITDGTGHTYNKVAAINNASGGELSIWIVNCNPAGSGTVTATFSGACASRIDARLYGGVLAMDTQYDAVAIATTSGNSTSTSLTTGTPALPDCLVVGAVSMITNPNTITPDATWNYTSNKAVGNGFTFTQERLIHTGVPQTYAPSWQTTAQYSAAVACIYISPILRCNSALKNFATATSTTVVPTNPSPKSAFAIISANVTTTARTISTITDTPGNVWTKAVQAGNNPDAEIWYAVNAASPGTITVTLSGASTSGELQYDEFSGVGVGTLLDQTNSNSASSTSASAATTRGTAAALELVVCVVATIAGAGTWTDVADTQTIRNTNPNTSTAHRIVRAGGTTPTLTFAYSTTATAWQTVLAAFKTAGILGEVHAISQAVNRAALW